MKDRKHNRMIGFDYSKDAIYFITSCCKNRTHFFGEVVNGEMQLNEYGKICNEQIIWLETQYTYISIHNFIVMPNHVHILFEINRAAAVGTGRDLSPHGRDLSLPSLPKIKSISSLIGAFKTTTSKQIHILGNDIFAWQRSFHDHIVRDEKRYERIFNYITDNPKRWNEDIFNTETNPNFKDDE